MIDWKEAQFRQIAIHQVGNSSAGKPLALSEQLTQVFPEDYPLMISHFLEPFRDREAYAFDFANGEVDLNAAYKFIQRLFDHPGHLLNISQDLARHLYEAAVHPNIKDGAFCVVHFNQVIYEDEVTDAVVLCKVEDQETFIQLLEADHHFVLNKQEGIPFQQLDKGCLIINTDRESGYQVFIIDQSNRALEAQYWRKYFLNVTPRADQYHQTAHLMQMTRSFVSQNLGEERHLPKTDQVHYLNKSMDYLKTHDEVDVRAYMDEVFDDPLISGVFAQFQSSYLAENEMEMEPVFEVSDKAVRKYAKGFKSVIKLDKNFHVYIHGDRSMIERGTDEDGRKFYKLYYQDEQ
ncbi:MAG: nucleoid-associated protein [Saprospiraceae bacterium]|nr:nucleoid-associated protein [Saprospiraceae bacterium]